jgi:phosphoglycolate phosphatase-like HAD superfamily hydrolase
MLDRQILTEMMQNAGVRSTIIRREMPKIVEQAQRMYVRSCPVLTRKVCPGARGLLYRLYRRRITTGLVTGNLSRIGWKKMERCGLRRYFRFGAFAELADTRAELVGLAIAEAHQRSWINGNARITLIGDHPNDINAARANGVACVAVATGLSPADELRAHGPDYLVDDLRSVSLEMLVR